MTAPRRISDDLRVLGHLWRHAANVDNAIDGYHPENESAQAGQERKGNDCQDAAKVGGSPLVRQWASPQLQKNGAPKIEQQKPGSRARRRGAPPREPASSSSNDC